MAKWSFSVASWTPAATADAASPASNAFQTLAPNSSTQTINVMEIYEGGQAGASSVNAMSWARASTVTNVPTALATPNSSGPLHPATAALAAVPISAVAATTGPVRANSAVAAKLNLSFNAFGGIVRWLAAPGEEWTMIGTTTLLGETLLSAQNVGTPGLMGSHIIFEPL